MFRPALRRRRFFVRISVFVHLVISIDASRYYWEEKKKKGFAWRVERKYNVDSIPSWGDVKRKIPVEIAVKTSEERDARESNDKKSGESCVCYSYFCISHAIRVVFSFLFCVYMFVYV